MSGLFFGNSSIIDKSISPLYVIARVLGIGVAVIAIKLGLVDFDRSFCL